jgi:inositol-pentakisphosphate 2-kinase
MSDQSNQRPLGCPPSSSVSEKVAISAPLVPHEPQIHCRKAHPKKLSNTFRFEYLGEGAANVVFRVRPFLDQDGSFEQEAFVFENQNGIGLTHEELDRKVLRMSKGKPKTLRYKEIMAGFQDDILPLFRKSTPRLESNSNGEEATPRESLNLNITTSFEEFVMQHRGVSICPEAIRVLISKLHQHCPHNRHITPHHLDEEGILLPDMSSEPQQSFFTVEVKPKWLLQSPNAPRDAYLCRTCARHESRKGKKGSKGPSICPLALAVGNVPAIEEWLRVTLEEASAGKSTLSILYHYSECEPRLAYPAHPHWNQTSIFHP